MPFTFVVEELFTLPGRGVIARGVVESGTLKTGDVLVCRKNPEVKLVVKFIEVNLKIGNEAYFSERAGLMFGQPDVNGLAPGDTLERSDA